MTDDFRRAPVVECDDRSFHCHRFGEHETEWFLERREGKDVTRGEQCGDVAPMTGEQDVFPDAELAGGCLELRGDAAPGRIVRADDGESNAWDPLLRAPAWMSSVCPFHEKSRDTLATRGAVPFTPSDRRAGIGSSPGSHAAGSMAFGTACVRLRAYPLAIKDSATKLETPMRASARPSAQRTPLPIQSPNLTCTWITDFAPVSDDSATHAIASRGRSGCISEFHSCTVERQAEQAGGRWQGSGDVSTLLAGSRLKERRAEIRRANGHTRNGSKLVECG